MAKRALSLYVDTDDIELAKAKGINLSALFCSILNSEIETRPDLNEQEQIALLKKQKGILAVELNEVRKQRDRLQKENVELKEEADERETDKHLITISSRG